jgi:hypothetical protein
VLARVGNAFGVTAPLRVIFDAPTVRALAEHVDTLLWSSLRPSASEVESGEREEVEL